VLGYVALGVQEQGEWEVEIEIPEAALFEAEKVQLKIANLGIGDGVHGYRFLNEVGYRLPNGEVVSNQIEMIPGSGGGSFLEPAIRDEVRFLSPENRIKTGIFYFFNRYANTNERFNTLIRWGGSITTLEEKSIVDSFREEMIRILEEDFENELGEYSVEEPEFEEAEEDFDEIDYYYRLRFNIDNTQFDPLSLDETLLETSEDFGSLYIIFVYYPFHFYQTFYCGEYDSGDLLE
jgi:hypothetical protein